MVHEDPHVPFGARSASVPLALPYLVHVPAEPFQRPPVQLLHIWHRDSSRSIGPNHRDLSRARTARRRTLPPGLPPTRYGQDGGLCCRRSHHRQECHSRGPGAGSPRPPVRGPRPPWEVADLLDRWPCPAPPFRDDRRPGVVRGRARAPSARPPGTRVRRRGRAALPEHAQAGRDMAGPRPGRGRADPRRARARRPRRQPQGIPGAPGEAQGRGEGRPDGPGVRGRRRQYHGRRGPVAGASASTQDRALLERRGTRAFARRHATGPSGSRPRLRLRGAEANMVVPHPGDDRSGVPSMRDAAGSDHRRRQDHVFLPELPAGPAARRMTALTATAKLVLTALMFAVALGLLAVAAATKSAIPLFFMWAPLFAVPWLLARPGPGEAPSGRPG